MNELYTLFRNCFPQIIRAEDTVRHILSQKENHSIRRYSQTDGRLCAAAVVHRNVVLMLCVLPSMQRQGIGSALLAETEAYVRGQGYTEIRFCDGFDYLTPGIPIYGEPYAANQGFFARRGYVHTWGDAECVDMAVDFTMQPAYPHLPGASVPGRSGGVHTYRFAVEAERPAVTACVLDAYEEFAEYYEDDALYREDSQARVLAAFAQDGRVDGALIVSAEAEAAGLGSVGCTATRQDCRGQGIATNMVCIGCAYLQSIGLPKGHLGYTYTDIVPMYARAGYHISMKYMMAAKLL